MILSSSNESELKKALFSKIKSQLEGIRDGSLNAQRIVLVVPAQATLLMEEEGFKELGGNGYFDFLVMSGARLREEVLKETGMPKKTAINSLGRAMLLRKIVKEEIDKLSSYKGVAFEEGFLDMTADLLVQLKQNEVDPNKLDEICSSLDDSSILYGKLRDIQTIYSAYEAHLFGKYIDSEGLLADTAKKLSQSDFIHTSVIWYYDFYSFTKNEYDYLQKLSESCAEFNIAILADSTRYLAGEKTCVKLTDKLGMKREKVCQDRKPQNIRVIGCASVFSQSETIANDILSRVRDEKLSYSDFVILSQDDEMRESLKRVLKSHGIPVFMDEKRSMQHSSLASFISYLFSVISNDFMPKDVIGLLKAGFIDVSENELCDFSNYVIQYKIFKKAFLSPFIYGKKDCKYESAEKVRQKVDSILIPFRDDFLNAGSVREKCSCIYSFLTDVIDVPGRLKALSKEFEENGLLDAAQELTQSFDVFVSLLDQMVELIGSEIMDVSTYAEILSSSFGDIKLGVLPQSFGKVSIGSVTRSSFDNIKYLYIAGFNEGIIPSNADAEAILTDGEILKLKNSDIDVVKDTKTIALEEQFQINRVIDSRCNELTILYCASNSSGESLEASPMLLDIVKEKKLCILHDVDFDDAKLGYIQNISSSKYKMMQFLKAYLAGENIPMEWMIVFNYLRDKGIDDNSFSGLFYNPKFESIDSDLAADIFKKHGEEKLSPSQLESFGKCPFRHFIQYGLNPDEEKEFSIDAAAAGTIYHEVMERISKKLNDLCLEKGIVPTSSDSPWMNITDEDLFTLVKEALDDIRKEFDGVMISNKEEVYKGKRIERASFTFAKYMIEQLRKGSVSAMYFERKFGMDCDLPALSVDTKYGKVYIEGTIDRTDIISASGKNYVKIIDYKSGERDFRKEKIDAGVELQLMIYLEAAMGGEKDKSAGGVFYYVIKNVSLDDSFENVISSTMAKEVEEKLAKHFALDGVMLDDPELLYSMDKDFNIEKQSSENIKTKSGKAILSEGEMNKLRDDFKSVLGTLCEKLKEGRIDIIPAKLYGKNIGCDYCPYESICVKQFAYK